MISDKLPTFNTKSLAVYGAQQRLKYLGYDVEVTGHFLTKTFNALEDFQKEHNLKLFALYDETIQKLEQEVQKKLEAEDPVLEKALEWLKTQ